MPHIKDNIRRIRADIDAAADGRHVTLVAATKTQSAAVVRAAVESANPSERVDACGENRVQELLDKLPQDAYDGVGVHFIGRLQSNKVKSLVGKCELIQSVDSSALLALIAKQARLLDITQDVLLQVNIGHEPQKGGIDPDVVGDVSAMAREMSGIRLRGYMCVPPADGGQYGTKRCFLQMLKISLDNQRYVMYNNVSSILSMGMSGDYIEAVRCGSTMVRLGSAIFGARG